MGTILKNECFRVAVDYLRTQNVVKTDKELAKKIDITPAALSRIRKDLSTISDDTLYKMNDAFGGIFNMAYFRGESDFLLVEDAKQKAVSPSTDEPTANIIELYASLIQDIEKIRQQVKQELAEVQALKHEYIEARDDFRKAITLLHPALKYEIPNEQPRMAAEPETPQK
jgi:transcriptional regulator with XRE-family HTH domain